MKKITFGLIFFIFLLILFSLVFLSTIGYETNKFNSILEKKITSNLLNTKINLNKIKIKIDFKNLSFYLTTLNPNIKYHDNDVRIKKVDTYINFKSLFVGKPNIDFINISSHKIKVNEIKEIIKFQKPSNFKKFFLNDVDEGEITFKLDLNLVDNQVKDYEINGIVKNFFAKVQNIDLKKTSFIYSFKKHSGEINNLRGIINGFQINTGNIEFENSKSLNIKGNINSDLKMIKSDFEKLFKSNKFRGLSNLQLTGKIQSLFKVNFDKTLKVIDYQIEASGNIDNSKMKFEKPKKYLFIKNKINNFEFEKTKFIVNFKKDKKTLINLSGNYRINEESLQKFDFKNLFDANSQELLISGEFVNEIDIPLINYKSKNKPVSISAILNINKDFYNLNKFNLTEGKNKIEIKNLLVKNSVLLKFDNILIKTFKNGKYNNDFSLDFGKKIKLKGFKYDASNLTNLIDQNNDANFFKNISKEININIKEVSTKASEKIFNFNLIGNLEKGKLNKIVSKGEFKEDKYLDISLKVDKASKKKVLEIYSDLPKPLLSNYKFFDGLTGGQLLIFSSYDSKTSKTNLTIENFKVRDAPGLVKLFSLADFGGMVDALSGEGLSFEKLEMSLEKNDQVLNLKELYAIGPSISILMEGYVDSKSGLVSLRGTMVPAKTLNKFLSKLPIVGDIIIPKEVGEGLFGISFKMKGSPENMKTTVNPIKTLTPRFIQKALKRPK